MGKTLGTMITMTTYGTWLRGDGRGWVEDRIIMPPIPNLESADRKRMLHDRWVFPEADLLRIGAAIGKSLIQRKQIEIYALTVHIWHAHVVIAPTHYDISEIVKCAKDAARYELKAGRPLWTDGYDKRFCFDDATLINRVRYVERHNEERGWPARPWDFIAPLQLAPGH